MCSWGRVRARGTMAAASEEMRERSGHIVPDRYSREKKAAKIEYILSKRARLDETRLLDIGAGAGYIGNYFRNRCRSVVVVDRERNLAPEIDLEFYRADGIRLPFDNESFDLI